MTPAGKGFSLCSFVNLCLLTICLLLWVKIFTLNYVPLHGEHHQCLSYLAQLGGRLTHFSLVEQPPRTRGSRAGHGREALPVEVQSDLQALVKNYRALTTHNNPCLALICVLSRFYQWDKLAVPEEKSSV